MVKCSPLLDACSRGRKLLQADEAQAGIKRIPLRMPDGLTGQTCAEASNTVSAPGPDSVNERSNRSRFSFTLTVPALFVLIYPLSVGPVARYYHNNLPAPQVVANFYAPLGSLSETVPAIHYFFDWYLHLWGVR